MASSVAAFKPSMPIPHTRYMVEVILRPSVPDTIGSWQFFEDKGQILSFFNCIDEFSCHVVDDVHEGEDVPLVQLRNNRIIELRNKTQRQSLQLRDAKYCFVQGGLRWRNLDVIILLCVDLEESKEILHELHAGVCGKHFSARTIAHKVMRVGHYYPTLFVDVHAFIQSCEACQRFEGKQKLHAFPLDKIIVQAPFQQWALDFI